MKVTKRFKAEIAHRLVSSYSKRCQSIHGHSYLFEVRLQGPLNEDMMVMDFGELKDKFNGFLDKFDHTLVLFDKDPITEDLEALSLKHDMRFMVVDYNPTAESMAYHIFNEALKLGLPVIETRVQETLTGWATATTPNETIKGIVRELNLCTK